MSRTAPGPAKRPFPLKPLADRLGSGAPMKLRMNGSVWKQLNERGSLSADEADRLAVRAGFHPADVWGDLWFSGDAEGPTLATSPALEPREDLMIATGRTVGCSLTNTNSVWWPPLGESV